MGRYIDQRDMDHSAPFRDLPGETLDAKVARVSRLSRAVMLDWYGRFGKYTHPDSMGQHDCGFASTVGYHLTTGTRPATDTPAALSGKFAAHDAAVNACLDQLP